MAILILYGSSLEHSTKSQRVNPKLASELMSLGLDAHLDAVQALDEGVHRGLHLVAKVSTAGFATSGAVSALRSLHCCPQGSRGFTRCCHYSSGPSANSERVEGVLDEVPGQRAAGRSLRSGLLAYVAAVDQNVGRLPQLERGRVQVRPARGHWPQRLREWQRVSGDPPLELLGLLAQLGYAKLSQTESFRLNLFQLEQCGLMTHSWHQCRVLLSFLLWERGKR